MEYGSPGAQLNCHEARLTFLSTLRDTARAEEGEKHISALCGLHMLQAAQRAAFGGLVGFGGKGPLVQGRAEDLRMPGKEWGEHPLTLDKRL